MSTPETNKQTFDIEMVYRDYEGNMERTDYPDGSGEYVIAEFARKLERQRDELLKALEELRDAKWLNLPGRAGDIVEAAIAKAKEAA